MAYKGVHCGQGSVSVIRIEIQLFERIGNRAELKILLSLLIPFPITYSSYIFASLFSAACHNCCKLVAIYILLILGYVGSSILARSNGI